MTTATQTASASTRFERLRHVNGAMAVLYLVNGIAILLLANDFSLPVETAFLEFDEQADRLVTNRDTWFDLPLAPLIAAFVFISAGAHLLVTLPGAYDRYVRNV